MKVFIVEDNVFYSSLLKEQLESYSMDVTVFDSGESCINHLSVDPDVILLDHDLNGQMTGLDTLIRIRAFSTDIKVIYVTSGGNRAIAIKSISLGAFDYLLKNEDTFQKVVEILNNIRPFDKKPALAVSICEQMKTAITQLFNNKNQSILI